MIIDSFIDVTKTILKNYLTNNDRLGIFLLLSEHRIICPLMCKYEIDIANISKDLDTYSTKILKKERFDSSLENEIIPEKLARIYLKPLLNICYNPFADLQLYVLGCRVSFLILIYSLKVLSNNSSVWYHIGSEIECNQ